MARMPTVELSDAEFDALLDYSCSIPTGVIIGKRWKRGEPYGNPTQWFMGEYVASDEPEMADIRWSKIAVKMPLLWEGD